LDEKKVQQRRSELEALSDQQLNEKFWELAERIVDPLINLAHTHTSPSIERSVLLRMGFNSLQAKVLVDKIFERGLLGKGAGHIVWRISKETSLPVVKAGLELIEGRHWDEVDRVFKGVH